jgi:hypothetical protein
MSSDNDIPRDPESGQFISPYDGSRQFEFTPLEDRPRDDDAPIYDSGSDDDKIRAAAAERLAQHGVPAEEPTAIEWFKRDQDGRLTEEPLEKNISITIDQAADGLSAYRAQGDAVNELTHADDLVNALDKARAEIAKDPAAAAAYGIEPAHPWADTPPPTPTPTAEPTPQATPTPDGLDPAVAAALQNPQIRAAVEQELAEAVQAKQQYSAAIEQANLLAQSSLIDHLPELSRLDKSQWESAILTINAQDPARVQRAMNTISRVQQLSAESAGIQNERAAQMKAETQKSVAEFSRSEDAKFMAYAAKENLDVPELGRAMQQYFHYELGVPPETMKLLIEETPALRSAAFQRLIADAVRYRQVVAAKQDITRKALPPAPIRPGASPAAAPSYNAGKITDLTRALSNASGDRAVRLAAKITSLKRQG